MPPISRQQQYTLVGATIALLVAFICSSPSVRFAIIYTALPGAVGLVAYGLTSLFLRTKRVCYLPVIFQAEPKKLSQIIWSGQYKIASADSELMTSLEKSYSNLPLILGESYAGHVIIPAKVDAALERLSESFIRLYVSSWYAERISSRPDFIEELRRCLADSSRSIYKILLKTDFSAVISQKIAVSFLKHLYIAKSIAKQNKNNYFNGSARFTMSRYSRLIMLAYFKGDQVHPAMNSSAEEAIYLRALVDLILPVICPREILDVQSGRVFLREALASKLLWLANYLANPITINKLLLLWATPNRKLSNNISSWRLLLADYGWRKSRTTSLLSFTLLEITPQHGKVPTAFDSRLLYAFQQFLRKQGSKYLDIFILYQEINKEVIPVFSNARLLGSNGDRNSVSLRKRLFNRVGELYRAYVDPDALRNPSMAEIADEPVLGSDPYDSEGVKLAQEWKRVILIGQDILVDPDTAVIFHRIKQHLENRLQPLVYEFNLSELAIGIFKDNCVVSGQMNHREPPSRRQVVDTLVKGSYKFRASNGKPRTDSDYSLNFMADGLEVDDSDSKSGLRISPALSLPINQNASPSSFESSDGLSNSREHLADDAPSILETEIPNISAWRVSIPFVEFSPTNKYSSGSQQYIPIYIVTVKRVDFVSEDGNSDDDQFEERKRFYLPGDESRRRSWSVRRYLDQFYLLEQKLKERYSDLIDNPLPQRSRMFTLLREDRSFYERRRSVFELFLQSLFNKAELRNSRLLYNFLTTDEGFNQRSPGERGLGRKLLRGVLVKSESKPLDGFFDAFQLVAEAPSLPVNGNPKKRSKNSKTENDNESTLSLQIDSLSDADKVDNFPSCPEDIYGDNAALLFDDCSSIELTNTVSSDSLPDNLFDLASGLGKEAVDNIVAKKFPALSNLINPAFDLSSFLLRDSAESLLQRKLNILMENTLIEDRVSSWINTLDTSLNEENSNAPVTWGEYDQAREETLTMMTNVANVPKQIAELIVGTLQEPIANKQLLYSLLDILVEELFPAVFKSKVGNV